MNNKKQKRLIKITKKLEDNIQIIKNKLHNEDKKITKKLEDNIKIIKDKFINDDTLVLRKFENQKDKSIKFCLFFIDGMVNNDSISENIIKPLIQNDALDYKKTILEDLKNQVIHSYNVNQASSIDEMVNGIISGDTVLLLEHINEGLIISTNQYEKRQIEEPTSEKVLRGPREGFNESLITNLSLIRRKLQIPNLRFKFRTFGKYTKTKTCICYIEELANEQILVELNKRLDSFELYGLLDANYIQEYIKDSPYSPFKTIGSTERPDVVVAKLLEGRIAIVVDGTPVVLTLPYLFIESLQSNEDYYTNFYFASIGRILRIVGFFSTISVPALYLSLVAFHKEIIPTDLLLSIYTARKAIPFPTAIELYILLFVFEVLREAGTRVPSNIGQALSIVGALVLGQAAVDAKFVSAPIVIVVGFTGITSLTVPRLSGASIFIRLSLVILSSIVGLYGYIVGLALLLLHMFDLRSFGVQYMLKTTSYKIDDIKDTTIRAPWWYMDKKYKDYIDTKK